MSSAETQVEKPGWLERNSLKITTATDLVRLLLMLGAIVVAFGQIGTQWQIQNEQNARTAFREFLKISMENPNLSAPSLWKEEISDTEWEKYFWYVQLMSQTFEEVFEHVPEVEAWIDLAEVQFDQHCGYFLGEEYIPELYSDKFRNSVAKVLSEIDSC